MWPPRWDVARSGGTRIDIADTEAAGATRLAAEAGPGRPE
jgi:hypothetical protein